jgi:hypothetical protein
MRSQISRGRRDIVVDNQFAFGADRDLHQENAESAWGTLEALGNGKITWNGREFVEAIRSASDIDSRS